jgi:hypothetical protein
MKIEAASKAEVGGGKKIKMAVDLKGDLLEGVEFTKLTEKYKKRTSFNPEDLKQFAHENEDGEFDILENMNVTSAVDEVP